jgi:adenosylmethionine-8-amino-7-oxononanoate aminotransferase
MTTVGRDARHVWHPFTQHSVWADEPPLAIASGHGPYLVGEDGREYLDGCSSLWVSVHGHREPAIDAAIRTQLDRVAHSTFLGLTHEPAVALAERLIQTAPPGLTRVFYAGDGSSAVEAALKMAYQSAYQRGESRPLYVRVEHGYHGDTLGAVSVGGIDTFHAAYRPLLLETRAVSSPGIRAAGQPPEDRAREVVAELALLLEREGRNVSAVVVEPLVQAAGGILTHDPAFLRGVRDLCTRHGVLMLADEVATGVGRTGTMWACEQAGVAPDLLTCGKGLSGGYLPIAAVLATEAVYEAFLGRPEDARTFFHGHTYTANPLACAASVANLDLMAERGTVARAAALGERLGTWLEPLRANASVADLRRAGTMTGIELRRADGRPYDPALRVGHRVCRLARDRGVLIRPLGDVVVLMPPLALPDAEAKTLVEVTTACVADVTADLA